MAFLYDKQSQSAFDADTQTTIRIAPTFLDTYPQPFEFMTAGRSFYVDYEMEEEPRRITLENGNIDMHCDVAILKLQDWHVKCEFVLRIRGHLKFMARTTPSIRSSGTVKPASRSLSVMDEEKNTRRGKAIFWTVYAFVGLRVKPPRVFALSSLNTSPRVYAWRDHASYGRERSGFTSIRAALGRPWAMEWTGNILPVHGDTKIWGNEKANVEPAGRFKKRGFGIETVPKTVPSRPF